VLAVRTPMSPERIPIGTAVHLACLLEVAAPKPGNVSPGREFPHLGWLDFAVAGTAIAPILAEAPARRLGTTILDAVRASRAWTRSNANLGIVLLLAPLAKAYHADDPRGEVASILASLERRDSEDVYEAIRLANPKGLGTASEHDVRGRAPDDLIAAMRCAEDRDLIARQYARGFVDVFDGADPLFRSILDRRLPIDASVVLFQLEWMRRHPDSDISRSCGRSVADEASRRAGRVVDSGWPRGADADARLKEFDDWLRADDHRRNPGTTADFVAAALFVALRAGIIAFPLERADR